MDWKRLARHLSFRPVELRHAFPPATLDALERAIGEAELGTEGEIRFAIEGALHPLAVVRGRTGRARALQLFSELRVWDTERNTGVLVYLLFADRDIEIVADRGIHARVGDAAWTAICSELEAALRAGRYEEGAIAAVRAIGALLAREFPLAGGPNQDELPDRPVVM